MLLGLLLLAFGVEGIVQATPILSPKFNDVLENSSLELTCYAKNGTITKWGTRSKVGLFSHLEMNEGKCFTEGFLADERFFETRCSSNSTFKVILKRVNISHHGQEWYCSHEFKESNDAYITVQVPNKYVIIRNISNNVVKTVENMKATLICETSEGRPPANITWTKISMKGIKTDLINGMTHNKTPTKRNMTIVSSSIDIEPVREDNGTRIICQATNIKAYVVRKEITIHVQYPPSEPLFSINGTNVNGSISFVFGENVSSIICNSDSFPFPSYTWTSASSENVDGQFLNYSKIIKNDTWQCTATNTIKLSNKTTTSGRNASKLKIDMFYPSTIRMFDFIGRIESKVLKSNASEIITFKCSIGGYEDSEIKLLFHKKILRRNVSTKTLIHNHRITSCLDNGAYTCEAKNKYNSKPSIKHLNLAVRCIPIISPGYDLVTNIFSAQHTTITFQFKAVAYPTSKFQWLKFSGSSWKVLIRSSKCEIHTDDNYSYLTVRDITFDDYGVYKLMIENDVGVLEQLYYLKANDNHSNKKSKHVLMYVIGSGGGFILIFGVFFVTWFSRKRLSENRSTARTINQSVRLSSPEAEYSCIYQNLPSGTQAAVNKVRPTRQPVVIESQEMTGRRNEEPAVLNEFPIKPQESGESIIRTLDLEVEEPYTEASDYCNTLEIINRIANIKCTEIYDYVRSRTDESFSVDFQKIPPGFQMPCCFARKPENIALNRYKDILPYDHTRVRIDDQPDFFINASYIDGHNELKAYIACLGPTAATHDNFKTFWKMVWFERSELIVMVTNLNETSGMKCEQYWPDANQDEMYGDILVSCQKIEIFAEYTIRSFEVTRTTEAGKVCRNLIHLHYTAWPDKRTPEDVTSLLEFGQTFHDIRTTVSGPLIIHCSAGIGRTGVFIAIDKLIMEGKNEGSVNVIACITKMREERVRMVQTSEQYKFIFQVLAYALNFDCKPIPIENLTQQFESEMADDVLFEKQYKELNLALEEESNEQIDCREKNRSYKDKNRQGADIPDNSNRVYLYQNRSSEDTDYINAVFINSYKCKDHFIMAQSPLPGTESDFLTLIYQENCFCIISMDDDNDLGMKIGKYLLKENQSLDIGNFTVSCFLTDSKEHCIVRKVIIKNNDEFSKGERYFYHFQYRTWTAENDIPLNVEEFVDFVKDVQDYAKLGDDSSHVLAHCFNASERSGLFCAIAIIREKLLFDEQVSILNTLRHLRTRRPSAITSLDQLKFCYKAAVATADKQHERIYINDQNMI